MQSQFASTADVGTEILSDAKSLGTSALERVHSELDTRKDGAVAQVKSVSSAIGSTVDNLDPATPTWLKSALQQGASQVQTLASSLEQKDSRELAKMVSDFARRSPLTFVAACAAAGFGAARLLKAGGAMPDTAPDYATSTDAIIVPQTNYHPDSVPGDGAYNGQPA